MSRPLRVAIAHTCPITRAALRDGLADHPFLRLLDDGPAPEPVDVVLAQPELATATGPDLILLAEPGCPDPALDVTLGAPAERLVDVVPLPAADPEAVERAVQGELLPSLRRLAAAPEHRAWCTPLPGPLEVATRRPDSPYGVVAVGSGRGGLPALNRLLAALPPDLPVPVVVAQHLPAGYHGPLADRLNLPGLRLVDASRDASQGDCVDALFRAVARRHRHGVLAVLLGGLGRDGVQGATVVRAAGGTVLSPDEASTRPGLWTMPGAVAAAGQADRLVPLADLPAALAVTLTLPLPAGFGRHARGARDWRGDRADLVAAGT